MPGWHTLDWAKPVPCRRGLTPPYTASVLASLARPLIATQRLLLLAAHPSHAAAATAFHLRNRARFARWDPPVGDDFFTESHQTERLRLAALAFFEGSAFRYWLCEPGAPQRILGTVHFSQVTRGAFHSATLGYALDAEFEGRGLMAEALRAGIAEMFSPRVNLHRVQAGHRPENLRSAATLARLGFEPEGLAREYLYIDGAWRDHVITALRNPDFAPPTGW